MHRRPTGRSLALAALLATIAFTPACGDDDGTELTDATEVTDSATPASGQTPSTERDRERDRDRLHQTTTDILDACRTQDQERLRIHLADGLQDQVQEQLRDGSCIVEGSDDLNVAVEQIEVDGDEATVRFTLRHRHRGEGGEGGEGGEDQEQQLTWRFRWTAEHGWRLEDPDGLFEDDER